MPLTIIGVSKLKNKFSNFQNKTLRWTEFVLSMLTCPNFCLSLMFLGSKLSLRAILWRISSATFVSPPFSVSSLVRFFSCFNTSTTFSSVIVTFAISLNYKKKILKVTHLTGLSKNIFPV